MTIVLQGYVQEATGSARGQNSHAEGGGTIASGLRSHAEGQNSQATASYTHAEGASTVASGTSAHSEGYTSVASGAFAHAGGYNAVADMQCQWARGGAASTGASGMSRLQTSIYVAGASTSGTGAAYLLFDGGGSVLTTGEGRNAIFVPTLATFLFRLELVARRTGSVNASQGWVCSGLVARDASANVRLVGSVTQQTTWADTTVGSYTVTANATSQFLAVTVTGTSGLTTWAGTLTTTEVVNTS